MMAWIAFQGFFIPLPVVAAQRHCPCSKDFTARYRLFPCPPPSPRPHSPKSDPSELGSPEEEQRGGTALGRDKLHEQKCLLLVQGCPGTFLSIITASAYFFSIETHLTLQASWLTYLFQQDKPILSMCSLVELFFISCRSLKTHRERKGQRGRESVAEINVVPNKHGLTWDDSLAFIH